MRTKRQPAGRSAFRHTPLVAALASAFAQGAMAGVIITVGNDLDAGPGSLRAAIDQANTECSVNGDLAPVIRFSGPFVIRPSSQLPYFQCSNPSPYTPSIDGLTGVAGASANTDPGGFNANLPVILDGSSELDGGCALQWNSSYGGSLSVRGLEIRNFNYLGSGRPVCGRVNLTANRIVNNAYGVYAWGGSAIGGADPGDRNVIADQVSGAAIEIQGGSHSIVNNFLGTRDGVTFNGVPSGIQSSFCCSSPSGTISGNVIVSTTYGIDLNYDDVMTISGNMIGTDVTGTNVLGSTGVGISLYYSYGASISDNVIAGQSSGAIAIYRGGYAGNPCCGDVFSAANGVSITNNRIGTDKGGGAVLGNSSEGIYDAWSYGTKITGGNVISGNGGTGVYLQGTQDAEIIGNFIGVSGSGSGTTFGNGGPGVYAGALPAGTLSISGNIISGNSGAGVYLSDASDVSIVGNYIGTDGSGLNAIPNQSDGLALECGERLTVEGNVLSGNTSDGIDMSGIIGSSFSRNKIGVGANGFTPLPNDGDGIDMGASDCGSPQLLGAKKQQTKAARAKALFGFFMSSGNTFQDNIVSSNLQDGINLQEGSDNYFTNNTIRANLVYGITVDEGVGNNFGYNNSIHGNGEKNVDLGFPGGPLVNDPGDADGSPPDVPRPNNWQNKPDIKSAVRDPAASQTTVTFDLDSQAGTFNVDLYSNPSPGKAAGAKWLATTEVVIASPGIVTGQFFLDGITEDNFSAIATRTGVADSSEFAELFAATTVPTPAVTVIPTSINFGDVVVGRSSGDSTITVTSEGTAPYVINALRDSSCTGAPICSTGAFTCSTGCLEATPYSRGVSCSITASFAPTALGSQTHTLALCDNAAGSPRTLTFTGNGVPTPEVDIAMAPSSWSFGEVLVGAQSTPKSFTVANAGASQVYLSDVRVLGEEFVITGNTCGPTLAAGASCRTDVTFIPAGKGVVSGSIQVTGSNTPPSAALRKVTAGPSTTTVSASLLGVGAQFGDLRLPASLSFGTLVLNSSPGRQTVPISNFGNGPLTVSSVSVSGPFTMSNDCGPSLAPGAACTITLTFNPATLGTFNGTLTIVSDAPGGSRAIALSAQVVADARPVVRVNPTSVGFGERVIGSQSPTQRVTVTNEGAESAILGAFTFVQPEEGTGAQGKIEFSLAGTTCTGTLAPQATCFADVIMKPLGFGGRTGQMVVPSNSVDSPRVVTLGGTGCRPFAAGNNRAGRDPCAQ